MSKSPSASSSTVALSMRRAGGTQPSGVWWRPGRSTVQALPRNWTSAQLAGADAGLATSPALNGDSDHAGASPLSDAFSLNTSAQRSAASLAPASPVPGHSSSPDHPCSAAHSSSPLNGDAAHAGGGLSLASAPDDTSPTGASPTPNSAAAKGDSPTTCSLDHGAFIVLLLSSITSDGLAVARNVVLGSHERDTVASRSGGGHSALPAGRSLRHGRRHAALSLLGGPPQCEGSTARD